MNITSKAEVAMAQVIRDGFSSDLSGTTLAGATSMAFAVNHDGDITCTPEPGKEFVVGVYQGESEETVKLPAIVISAHSANEDMDARGNYSIELDVAVTFNADSSEQNPWTVDAMRYIGDGVRNIIGNYTLPNLLTAATDDFGCMGVESKRTSREVDGRTRTQRHSMTIYCCGTTI